MSPSSYKFTYCFHYPDGPITGLMDYIGTVDSFLHACGVQNTKLSDKLDMVCDGRLIDDYHLTPAESEPGVYDNTSGLIVLFVISSV